MSQLQYTAYFKFIDSHTHLENRDEECHNHRPNLPHSLSRLHDQFLYSKRILLLWLLERLHNSSKCTYEKYHQVVFKFFSQCHRHLMRMKSNPDTKEFRAKYNDGDETKREIKQQIKMYLTCSSCLLRR